jgi:hypothetical protein
MSTVFQILHHIMVGAFAGLLLLGLGEQAAAQGEDCAENNPCSATAEYCAKEVGDCDGNGTCTARPTKRHDCTGGITGALRRALPPPAVGLAPGTPAATVPRPSMSVR